MGMQTGNIAADLRAPQPVSMKRPKPPDPVGAAPREPVRLGSRPEPELQIQAGFGEDTLSPSGAALKTLDANLDRARTLVPSMQELSEEYRARRAEQKQAREERTEAASAEPREVRAYREVQTRDAVELERPAPDIRAAAPPANTGVPEPPVEPPANVAENPPAPPAPAPRGGMTPSRLDILV